jgi:hypothetical protein
MDTRPQLHALLDDFDDDEIIAAEMYLFSILHRRGQPERNDSELARLNQRGDEFGKKAEEHWREAGQGAKESRGIVSSFGGGGGFGFDFRGRGIGKRSYEYWDGGDAVVETLRFVAGHEIEIIERFGLSNDGTSLLYKQEIKSGGREVSREEAFPVQRRS